MNNTVSFIIGVAVGFLACHLLNAFKKAGRAAESQPVADLDDEAAVALAIAAAARKPVDDAPVALAIAAALFRPAEDEAPVALAIAAASRR